MRGVLVDDDQAVAGLGEDVGLVDLRAGRAQGMIGRLRAGDRAMSACGGAIVHAPRTALEHGLCRLAETRCGIRGARADHPGPGRADATQAGCR